MSVHTCWPSPDPRRYGYCSCGGRLPDDTADLTITRDRGLERSLTELAAQAGSFFDAAGDGDTGGLDEFADDRARPGGIRPELDADQELREELADARNYAIWGIQRVHEAYLAGESQASSDYERRMRCLAHIVAAWHMLRTDSS